MHSHQLRYTLIAICFFVTVIGLVVALLVDKPNVEIVTGLLTAAGIFGPALVDAKLVERRRRDPKLQPIVDDVTSETPPHVDAI